MKKKILLIVMASFLLTGVVSAANLWGTYKGQQKVKVVVSGAEYKTTGVPPINFNGQVMVPLNILKQLNVAYSWDAKKQTATITKQLPATTINPVASTNAIINLGGGGVTLMNVAGSLTSMVYYPATYDLDTDWPKLLDILYKLIDFNATYSSVEYFYNGQSNIIEAKTSDIRSFRDGIITAEQMNKLWITQGPLFSNESNQQPGAIVDYPELYSGDGKVYLGRLTSNEKDADSVFNEYGTYGSKYGSDSIWNEYGTYGSKYNSDSAFNDYATDPPIIVLNGKTIGYLTTNKYLSDAISPYAMSGWMEKEGY